MLKTLYRLLGALLVLAAALPAHAQQDPIRIVGLYAAVIAEPSELHRIRSDAFATLAYVANWRFVFGRLLRFVIARVRS